MNDNVTVEPRVLMTLQQSGAKEQVVELLLESTETVDDEGVSQGVFLYDNEGDLTPVNIIDSVFKNDVGNAGKKGPITLSVSLPSEGEFWYPYVTTTVPTVVPLECVEAKPKDNNKKLELTFLEPDPNQSLLESLMFYTEKGPIDPGVSIRRGVGQ